MTTADPTPCEQELQFERAVPLGGEAPGSPGALACFHCKRPIETEYFQVAEAVSCRECKEQVQQALEQAVKEGRRPSGLARAMFFGAGAAVLGALIYWAVMALAHIEWAVVAIVCGWLVGWAVRRGSRGAGGRRYQWTAMLLTYMSVGLAYTPVFYNSAKAGIEKARAEGKATAAPTAPAPAGAQATTTAARVAPVTPAASGPAVTVTPAAPVTPGPAARTPRAARQDKDPPVGQLNPVVKTGARAIFVVLLLLLAVVVSLALPLLVVLGSLPGGLLSAVIIAVGMQQAWKMTAGLAIPVSGPFRVGTPPPGVAAPA